MWKQDYNPVAQKTRDHISFATINFFEDREIAILVGITTSSQNKTFPTQRDCHEIVEQLPHDYKAKLYLADSFPFEFLAVHWRIYLADIGTQTAGMSTSFRGMSTSNSNPARPRCEAS